MLRATVWMLRVRTRVRRADASAAEHQQVAVRDACCGVLGAGLHLLNNSRSEGGGPLHLGQIQHRHVAQKLPVRALACSRPIDPLSRRIEPLRRQIDPLSWRTDPLRRPIDPLSGRIDPLRRPIDPLSGRIDPLRRPTDPLSARIDPLRRRNKPLSRRIDPLSWRFEPLSW
eukprot:1061290-Prorocentrum_minimum.AAC.1